MTHKIEALRARAEKVGHIIEFDDHFKDYKACAMSRLPIEASGTIEEVEGYITYLETEENHCGLDNLDQVYVPVSPELYKKAKNFAALMSRLALEAGEKSNFTIGQAVELMIEEFCAERPAAAS